ncbi:MAG TPA: DUF4019 domain-containing protein [Candidatus Binatia bacterium]
MIRFYAVTTIIFALLMNIGIIFAEQAPEKPIVAAAQSWLGEIDSGNYAKSWQQASAYFQGAVSEKNWADALNGARRPLGNLISRKVTKTTNAKSLPGAPDGNYLVMQFTTSFANKKNALETVTFMREKDGNWRAAGYYIK